MVPPSKQIDAAPEQSERTVIYVAGDNPFNNEMLAGFLELHTNLPCRCIRNDQLSELCDIQGNSIVLLFLDCATMGDRKTEKRACLDRCLQHRHCKVVCFNLDPESELNKLALQRGIDGIIYNHQPVNFYAKAAQAVLNGELWYPRWILEQHLLTGETPPKGAHPQDSVLTRREKEILEMLTAGMTNGEIAAKLCISPHTVKTHAYNLYKKIKVTNRFEAAKWLSANS